MNVSKHLESTKTKNFATQKNLKRIIYFVNNKKWTKDLVFFYYIFNRGVDVQDIKSILNFIGGGNLALYSKMNTLGKILDFSKVSTI